MKLFPLQVLRRAALHHQGLTKVAPFGTGKQATQKAIEHLGYVQIDTLSVVERAHHHILWTRIPSYKATHLEKLLQERKVFEYWSHAAAFLPMRDYRFALPRMNAVKRGESKWFASVSRKDETEVLDRIRIDGPLRARDFDSVKEQSGSWWNWKPAKKALEKLFFQGDLMIASREGMQKVYDLRERVLPSEVDTREPTMQEFVDHLLDASLTAHGFTIAKQISHQRQGTEMRRVITATLKERTAAGELVLHKLEGLLPVYALPTLFDQKTPSSGNRVRLLSPFDNAVIHRERVEQLFDFSYRIECYTPQPKRQFGYFCLPILYGDTLIGRVDCKADRAGRHLQLLHLHIEKAIGDEEKFCAEFASTVQQFAQFNACDTWSLAKTTPAVWRRRFSQQISA